MKMLLLLLAAAVALAQQPSAGLVGDWQSPQGVIRFSENGTATMTGYSYRFTTKDNVLTMAGAEGTFVVLYTIQGDTMTWTANAERITLTRAKAGAPTAKGGIRPELAGKWCLVSNVYATGGGARATNVCLTLNADGTYQYSGETDSYGPNGGATSQTNDNGTWTATDTTISANSRLKGPLTYRLEKRNHPKNGDPMILIDGAAFVTFYQKPPWR